MQIKGCAWKFGDDVDTDQIIPASYLSQTDARALGEHCMEGLDPDFARSVTPGDIIVAGENFGCGSSREHAPRSILGAGVSAVVAVNFARIFYRNAVNTGLPILESEEAAAAIKAGDRLVLDLEKGLIKNETAGDEYLSEPFPEFMRNIIAAGGLMPYVSKKFKESA